MPSRSMWEVRAGGVTIDVPRSVGYFGGIAAAVAMGMVEPPLALFIAGVPVIKVLTHRATPAALRLVGEVLEGGAKPVGGDADAVVRLDDRQLEAERAAEIADLADQGHAARHRDATSLPPPRRGRGPRPSPSRQ